MSNPGIRWHPAFSKTKILLPLVIMLVFSCEDSFVTDCGKCYSGSDYSVVLSIVFRNPDRVPVDPVLTLYEGDISDSIIISRTRIEDPYSYMYHQAILYKDYSATLEFIYGGRKYVTTASACPKVRYDETTCDEPCYYVYDNILDMRLRYD